MANNGKQQDGDQMHDGWPKPNSSALAASDQSSITTGPLKAEAQAHSLVGLVLAGENPMKLMNRVIDQIHEACIKEEGGGPYHIGSTVRINTAGTYEKVGGGSQSIGYRDCVSIVNPFLGEQGKDAMVLLGDGITRCIVPWKSLGESVGWLKEADVDTGPDAFMGKPQTGSQLTADGEPQDDAEPKDMPSAQSAGASSPVTLGGDSQVQGDSAPDDEASARTAGQSTPSVMPGKAVEQRRECLQALSMFMETASDGDYRKMNEIKRRLESTRNARLVGMVHTMLFSESKQYSLGRMLQVVEQEDPPKSDDDADKDNPFPPKPKDEKCWGGRREADDDNPFPPKKDDDETEPKPESDEDPMDPGAGQFGGTRTGEQDDDEDPSDPTKPLQPAEDDAPGGAGPGVTPPMEDEPTDDDEPKDDDDDMPPMESRRPRRSRTESVAAKMKRIYGEDVFPGMTGDSASGGQPARDASAGMTGDATDDAGKKKTDKAGVTGDVAEEMCPDCNCDPCECPPQTEADDDKPDPGKKDYTSPQGEPGKNPSAPGVKESKQDRAAKQSLREGYKSAVSSIFRRLDEGR